MLMAVPRHWYNWDFTLTEAGKPLAELALSSWREQGVLTIARKPHRVYRERTWSGAFILEDQGAVLARAEKPSLVYRRMVIDYAGIRYELNPRSALSRHFQLLKGSEVVGTLSPKGLFSRHMSIDLPEELPLPVRAFVVWLTVILWQRDFEAAAAG